MIKAQPKTKASVVIDELSKSLASHIEVSEFSKRRYRKELEESIHADASEAYAGLGMLAVLEWNEAEVRSNFQTAIKLESEFTVHANFSTCLQRIGLYADGAEQARIASNLAATDIRALHLAVRSTMLAGQIELALEWSQKLSRLAPNEHFEVIGVVAKVAEIFDTANTPHSMMQEANAVASNLLRERKILAPAIDTEVDTEDSIVLFTFKILASDSIAAELDQELGHRLFDQVKSFNPGRYWVGFEAAAQ